MLTYCHSTQTVHHMSEKTRLHSWFQKEAGFVKKKQALLNPGKASLYTYYPENVQSMHFTEYSKALE